MLPAETRSTFNAAEKLLVVAHIAAIVKMNYLNPENGCSISCITVENEESYPIFVNKLMKCNDFLHLVYNEIRIAFNKCASIFCTTFARLCRL